MGLALVLRDFVPSIAETSAGFVALVGAVLLTSVVAGYRAAVVAIALGVVAGTIDSLTTSSERVVAAIWQAVVFVAVSGGVVSIAYGRARAGRLATREREARAESDAANARLRESEERFRLMLDEAPIGMAIVALDGRFVRVNRALCQLVGYTADELQQLRFQDITHPEDLAPDLAQAERLIRREIPRMQVEKRYIRKDGTLVTVLLHTAILYRPNGLPLYYISQITDISARKQTEEALRFSEARFSGIIAIATEAIISIDESQRITVFNDGAEKLFGYTRDEVIGVPIDILIPERYHVRHRRDVDIFLSGPATARSMRSHNSDDLVGRRKSGEEFPVEAAISKLQIDHSFTMTVVLHDVTEQRRTQREQRFLAEAGKILSSSLDYEQTLTTVGELVVRDLANWCVIQLAQGEHHPMRIRVIPDDPRLRPIVEEIERLQIDPTLPHATKEVWETRRPLVYEQLQVGDLERFSQSPEHLRLLLAMEPRSFMEVPLLVRGRIVGVLGFVLSKGERTYTERDLPLARALADRAALAIENGRLYLSALQAMKLRDQVLGVVAHDLRNPLTLIQLQTSSLEPRPGTPERRDPKPRQVILRATERMNRLIQDLLDVSQIEAGQLRIERGSVATDLLLEDVVEAERRLATAQALELQLELATALPDVLGDHDRISQVLENLIGNAIKFTPAGGKIVVGARPQDHNVLFWIADTGPGITAEGLDHIFDPFWQAKKGSRHGAGLGLPIARGIVEAHGGRIWVESTVGRGTIFFFTLPRAPVSSFLRPESLQPAS
ncbi:MAG: PAS domain S-box protein [Kofleriaceae bacterium]|nr:PAS domain S-box protein [Kofleriaceae bacterium]